MSNAKDFPSFTSAHDFGARCREVFSGVCSDDVNEFRWLFDNAELNVGPKNWAAFVQGYEGRKSCLHFVGVPARQRRNAVRMWGEPDYEWPTASFRILGECAPGDRVVFGDSAFVKPKRKQRSAE